MYTYVCKHKIVDYAYIFSKTDINTKDASGVTPMMNAIAHGHKEVVGVFLDKDYAIDTEVKEGVLLFEWAIKSGYDSLIQVLINIKYII